MAIVNGSFLGLGVFQAVRWPMDSEIIGMTFGRLVPRVVWLRYVHGFDVSKVMVSLAAAR